MVRADGVLLEAKRPAFLLDDLVARCDSTAPEPAHMTGWSNTKPVGREVWRSAPKFGRAYIVSVLVLAPATSVFNAPGIVLVAPIIQGGDVARHAGSAASLSGSCPKTPGAALVNQLNMLDLEARGSKRAAASTFSSSW